MKPKVLFLLPYPLHKAPSQRFRIEYYFGLMKRSDILFDSHTFLDEAGWNILYKGGSLFRKVYAVGMGYIRRLGCVLGAGKYDFIFVHREAAPLGPPFFEWWLSRVMRKKLIYDFDDAIWIPAISDSNKIAEYVKCFWKIRYICKWSRTVSVGNQYLFNWAKAWNNKVVLNPTCVDIEERYNQLKEQIGKKVTIGWTGSHSTLKYLDMIYPVLRELEKERSFEFIVICNQPPAFSISSLRFIPWKEQTEIEDLLKINIGIMPLIEDAWSEGKCGFKLIQYLALGIPAVASPVGVNKQIIEDGVNGRLCKTTDEWKKSLIELLDNEEIRKQWGQAGKRKIEQEYSIQSNASNFMSLFS